MKYDFTIAFVGNPNCGKTSIFNQLTGANQKVGNWSGVTVEKKEGFFKANATSVRIIDLPGIYSLTPFSPDEEITRDFILDENPDLIVNIIDSSNLERNLYLTTQLLELNKNMLIVLNMSDVAQEKGIEIDLELFSKLLDLSVVKTVGTQKKGVFILVDAIFKSLKEPKTPYKKTNYGVEIEQEAKNIETQLKNSKLEFKNIPSLQWLSYQILEGIVSDKLIEKIPEIKDKKLKNVELFTEKRYGFIGGILNESVKFPAVDPISITKNIDSILLHKTGGYIILISLFALMFYSTFKLGEIPMGWIESLFEFLKDKVSTIFTNESLKDVLSNGVLDGIGAVAIFLPNILILFLFISIFEDTGYMARAAFLLDKLMHKVGLHGKSFIPLIMGFGCNVPAMMAARTIEDRNNRLVTLILNPLVTCNARLPVYVLLAGTFFPSHAGLIITGLYFFSIVLIFIGAKFLTSTFFKTKDRLPFVMELPPYHMPSFKSILLHMWERIFQFIKKMGTTILVGSVLIWVLSSYPKGVGQENSYLGKVGKTISPIFEPLGFDYKDTVAILTGFVAKEIVVSTYGVLYNLGDEPENSTLSAAIIAEGKSKAFGFSFMLFILIYIPCLATLIVLRKETNSWKITLLASAGYFMLAYILSLIVFQVFK
ncbi:ferrous iron transport protein B [bacterium]|nr:ferrous iron transport protein B [bacterium]